MINNDLFSINYDFIYKNLIDGNYKIAIQALLSLDEKNLYSSYTQEQQIQIDLIYAYYKSNQFQLAKDLINNFLRINPIHPNVDYVLYMNGLIEMELDSIELQNFFKIDRSDRTSEYTNSAFNIFMNLINTYPNSLYSMDAYKRLIYLKNRLAVHEFSIVKYYNAIGAYVAVIHRIEKMLYNFPDTQATYLALPYMKLAYKKLGLTLQVDKIEKIIEENSNCPWK